MITVWDTFYLNKTLIPSLWVTLHTGHIKTLGKTKLRSSKIFPGKIFIFRQASSGHGVADSTAGNAGTIGQVLYMIQRLLDQTISASVFDNGELESIARPASGGLLLVVNKNGNGRQGSDKAENGSNMRRYRAKLESSLSHVVGVNHQLRFGDILFLPILE